MKKPNLATVDRVIRCIFCLEDRPSSEEHVFPLAISGRLKTDRLCVPCNSMLGHRVDAALSDSHLVRARRADLRLAGNHGEAPALHEILLGTHTLADHPEQRIAVRYDKNTNKLDLRHLHHASSIVLPDGTKARHIIIDERDIGQLPKLIQNERRRHGVPPLTDAQMAEEVRQARENVTTISNPGVVISKSYDFSYLRHALAKIAYELAFLWLGETYLDDPEAAELRAAICKADPASTDTLPMWVGDAEGCDAFKFWADAPNHHLAYCFAGADGISIAVRIFDLHAAVVWVTKDAGRYLSGPDGDTRLRFLSIDPITSNMRHVPMVEEWLRIVHRMTGRAST